MPQQQSPFLEGKYGWNFGESGWNTGMDENLLKFSYMFDRNVDGIVSSLPAAVNGQAYFLTTDNRLYFAVGNTWYSSPVPKWFEFKIRSTGDVYQFNGTSVVQIESPADLDVRLDAIELTVSTLGSAAFEDVSAFATTEELDIVEGQAQTYTDTLRSDLSNATDPEKGAELIGYKGGTLSTILSKTLYASQHSPAIVDAATFQNFLNLAQPGVKLVIDIEITVTKAGLEALPLYGLTIPAGGTVEWENGAWTKLEPGVAVRHIFTGQGAANSNVTYINPQIDGQDSSCNGIGGNNATNSRFENVWVYGGHIKNIARERVRGSFEGGLGVTFQFGSKNCGVRDTLFTRVHCATDASGTGNITSFGDSSTFNIQFIGIHCENCEQIGRGFNLLTNSSVVTALNYTTRWADVTFRNCGRSNEVGVWPGLSFTRVNNAGNSSPWTDIFITSTTYDGNWEPSTFSGADAEWTFATGSYAIGDRVKVTNDGTLSSLFHFQGNSGATVDGVNGYNEASYGQIGALISGTAGGITVRNFDVLCDVKDNVHCGAIPNVWPVVTRQTAKMADSKISLSNIGTAINAVGADGPSASSATPYVQTGLKVVQVVRRSNLTNILDSRLGGAADGFRNSVEIMDCAGAGSVVGTFDFIFNVQNTLPAGVGSSTFNRVLAEAQHIKVHQSNNQLRLERTGTNAGFADMYALGSELHLANSTTFTIDSNGGTIKLKNAAGTVYSLAVDASGRLTINGTVVGTQT